MSISINGKLYFNEIEKEEALKNNNALEYALSTGVPLKRVGNYYINKEHDSMVFTKTGQFFWHSTGIKGKAIEFIMEVEGRSLTEAIIILSNGVGAEYHNQKNMDILNNLKYEKKEIDKSIIQEIEEGKMVLPDRASNNNKIIDYLVNVRKIDKQLVNHLINKGMIYQSIEYPKLKLVGYDEQGVARYNYKDKTINTDDTETITLRDTKEITEYSKMYEKAVLKNTAFEISKQENLFYVNNLVMIGYNEDNIPTYASKRSINTVGKSYKLDVAGSKKSCPFVINKNINSETVVICESPIEVISYYELANKLNFKNKDAHIISAGGISDTSLQSYLKSHPKIKNISVALNNDNDGKHKENAGLNGYNNIYEKYSDKYIITKQTPFLNDWNDVLKDLKHKGIIKDINKIQININKNNEKEMII